MCRPLKNGLEYFPLDTDVLENRKVQRLLRKYGCEGFAVYSAVLCDIYRREGYYVRYDTAYCQDIAFVLNLPEENPGLVGGIIGYCIFLELFDAELAARESILTSAGIQLRYREVRKRYKVAMRNEFLLPAGTESGAALPGKLYGNFQTPGEKKKNADREGASFCVAGQPPVNSGASSLPVTESTVRSVAKKTSEVTVSSVSEPETLLVAGHSESQTKAEGSVGATETGETDERTTALLPGEPLAAGIESGLHGRITGVPVVKTPVNAAKTPVHVTETAVCVTETPVCVTETGFNVTETPVCVTETPTKEKENKKERKEKIEERVVEYYHFRLSGRLPPVARLTPGRVRAVRARVAEYGEAAVMGMLDTAAGSPFLLGENPRHWRADFDWLFKPANFVKVWEGNYVNSHRNETHSGSDRHAGERKREILRMAAEAASRDCIA